MYKGEQYERNMIVEQGKNICYSESRQYEKTYYIYRNYKLFGV
ncbi:hypothetical protein I656_04139 [Geobacillus sp. WSUCF1]|nr:hypothetical protein I656_04139 [Geobacillus sp. WSUCF1]